MKGPSAAYVAPTCAATSIAIRRFCTVDARRIGHLPGCAVCTAQPGGCQSVKGVAQWASRHAEEWPRPHRGHEPGARPRPATPSADAEDGDAEERLAGDAALGVLLGRGHSPDKHNLYRVFRRLLARAELPTHFTPHCLRHTFASL